MTAIKDALDLAAAPPWLSESPERLEKKRRRAEARAYWKDELPAGDFDLDLLPTRGTHAYLAEMQKKLAAQDTGVTLTAQVQRVRSFPVDRPLTGRVALMPRDERDVRDFHGKPLLVGDFTPGKVPFIAVTGATKHVEEVSEWIDEVRHYGQDAIPDEYFRGIEGDKIVEAHDRWVDTLDSIKRPRFSFSEARDWFTE